jgi:hypothetical protein
MMLDGGNTTDSNHSLVVSVSDRMSGKHHNEGGKRVTHMHSLEVRIFPGRTRYSWPVLIFTTSAALGSSIRRSVALSTSLIHKLEHTPDFSNDYKYQLAVQLQVLGWI